MFLTYSIDPIVVLPGGEGLGFFGFWEFAFWQSIDDFPNHKRQNPTHPGGKNIGPFGVCNPDKPCRSRDQP